MPPKFALLMGAVFILGAFYFQPPRTAKVSKALFWPTLWYLVVATRPFGVWMYIWGVPLPGGSSDATEGSSVDRYFYLTLAIIGFWILSKRGFKWRVALRRNPWLAALLFYMAASILWSQYSFVSFKRFVKVLGSIAMALVVLTEDEPFEAMLTVLRRCLYVHLPLSIICTKYFRDIGVAYDWFGTSSMWQGISTSKNTLGQVAMLGVVYFFWEVRKQWRQYGWRNVNVLYLLMAAYLLKGAPTSISMTSVSVAALALLIFLRLQSLRSRPEAVRPFVRLAFTGVAGIVILVLLHSIFMFSEDSPFGYFITKFGRDITLTDRTYIWHDVYAATADNPLFGVGYGGFWIERMANIPWNATMTWVLGQAHNGYIDTYLQLGLVGAFLLARVLFTTLPRLMESMEDDFDFGCFRITLFITILFVNITESTYLRGDHHLWFIMLLTVWMVPIRRTIRALPHREEESAPQIPREAALVRLPTIYESVGPSRV